MKDAGADQALSLLLVDDHAIVREGLKHLLAPTMDGWRLVEASNGHDALDVLRNQRCDLIVLDITMPGMNGLDLIRRIKAELPSTLILVLSMHAEEQYAMRAFKAGANGYVTKDSAGTELVTAVRKVLAGGAYVSNSLAEGVVRLANGEAQAPSHASLTDRELDVLRRLVSGQRPVDIAQALNLSVKTVSTHKIRIQDKLNLPSMAALIRYGLENRLADSDIGPHPKQA